MKDYLVSKGIVALLQNRYGLCLSKNVQEKLKNIENVFSTKMNQFTDSSLRFSLIEEDVIEAEMKMMLAEESRPIVSVDDVYFTKSSEDFYSMTRLTNPDDSSDKVIGPRFGKKTLSEQRERLANKYGNEEIALIDIGIFHGDTLLEEILINFPQAGINVGKVYCVVGNKDYLKKFIDAGVELVVAREYDFFDWVEARDLLGFDGRKPQREKLSGYDNINLVIPYKDALDAWAGIKDPSDSLKALCEQACEDLIDILKDDNINTRYDLARKNTNGTNIYTLEFSKGNK